MKKGKYILCFVLSIVFFIIGVVTLIHMLMTDKRFDPSEPMYYMGFGVLVLLAFLIVGSFNKIK